MSVSRLVGPAMLAVLALAGCASSGGGGPAATARSIRRVTPSEDYPLDHCVVMPDKPLVPGKVIAIVCDGTEVHFCCPMCIDDFENDPDRYLAIVRASRK